VKWSTLWPLSILLSGGCFFLHADCDRRSNTDNSATILRTFYPLLTTLHLSQFLKVAGNWFSFSMIVYAFTSVWKAILSAHQPTLLTPLTDTLKPQSNGPLCSNTATLRWLVHWPLMGGLLHLVQQRREWASCGPAQFPARCTKYNSPPINGQCTTAYITRCECTNFILFCVAP